MSGRLNKETSTEPDDDGFSLKLSTASRARKLDGYELLDLEHGSHDLATAQRRRVELLADSRLSSSRLIWSVQIFLVLVLGICLLALAGVYALKGSELTRHGAVTQNLFTLKEWRDGTLAPELKDIHWTTHADTYILHNSSGFYLGDYETRQDSLVIGPVFDYENTRHQVLEVHMSSDGSKVILVTDREKVWRHSTVSHMWSLDIKSTKIAPIHGPNSKISLTVWSPDSSRLAYVLGNNLSMWNTANARQEHITSDGTENLIYGRPDWVYEEEVFAGSQALWWSPAGDYLAYLRTNDTLVKSFPIQYYLQEGNLTPYPETVQIKYPKPGSPNPVVDLMLHNARTGKNIPLEFQDKSDQDLITSVNWILQHVALVKMTNRNSDTLKVYQISVDNDTVKVEKVRTHSLQKGWFDVSQVILPVPKDESKGRSQDGYIDIVDNKGFAHLAYFTPIHSDTPARFLTSGSFEIDTSESTPVVDLQRNLVIFASTERSAIDRHIYSVNLSTLERNNLTDTSQAGWHTFSCSHENRFALLSYIGPHVPQQRLVELSTGRVKVELSSNHELSQKLSMYNLPSIRYGSVELDDGISANYREVLPPSFSSQTAHPVIFYVYGGPSSQLVTGKYGHAFESVLATSLNAIVVTVDGRGTGFMGHEFRAVVKTQLGKHEAQDQIKAGSIWAAKPYVDASRMAIWGWSYGGYMTLKTLETDAGKVFSYGMAVAPVTDWRFYDSVYTERYMQLPEQNAKGYEESSIHNCTALGQNSRFLIMHGTGDDNVHFQNTLTLLDKLDMANVENYDVHVFPDSDHRIQFHNAFAIVFDKLLSWVGKAFDGEFKSVTAREL